MLIDAVSTFGARTPNAIACVDLELGQHWSYRRLDQEINRVANWLVELLGPASGQRVATIARNSAAMLMLNLACVRAGAIFVPCNWRLSTTELDRILDDAEPALIFCDEEFRQAWSGVPSFRLSDLATLCDRASSELSDASRRDWNEPATILYTSGTSGGQKGVLISERNAFWSQFAFATANRASANSVYLCDMPLFHTAGLLANARSPMLLGGTVLISERFDADKTVARLADASLAVTHYFSVPQMAATLWQHPDFEPEKLRHLQVYATGGAPNPHAQIERFVSAGICMSDGYGMTEAGSVSGMPTGNVGVLLAKAGSCGLPYAGMEARVVDDRGLDLPRNAVGELWLKGPGVTSGYWRRPADTERAFQASWLKSGDLARIDDDGFLFIVDRKKDMFISGGENVYSIEIESAISAHPGVDAVAVFGVPDEQWGEVGVACVVPGVDAELTADSLKSFCRQVLAEYKIPKLFVIRNSLPRTATGKIRKSVLKGELLSIQR